MNQLTPYLMFKGNFKEAMTCYGDCFHQKPEIMIAEDKMIILHSSIKVEDFLLLASDWSSKDF